MKPAIDVSGLPRFAFGQRDPIWWGVILMIVIEGAMFALCLVSYLYLRGNEQTWPPTGVGTGELPLGSAQMGILAISMVAVRLLNRNAHRMSLAGVRLWLGLIVAAGLLTIGLRGWEIATIPFRWDDNAYASIFWTILGLHTFHLVTATGENIVFMWLFASGPVEKKHHVDVTGNGIYWAFVVLSWLPFYALMYLERSVRP